MGVYGSRFKRPSAVIYDKETTQILAVWFTDEGVKTQTWKESSIKINTNLGTPQPQELSFDQIWGTQILVTEQVTVLEGKWREDEHE